MPQGITGVEYEARQTGILAAREQAIIDAVQKAEASLVARIGATLISQGRGENESGNAALIAFQRKAAKSQGLIDNIARRYSPNEASWRKEETGSSELIAAVAPFDAALARNDMLRVGTIMRAIEAGERNLFLLQVEEDRLLLSLRDRVDLCLEHVVSSPILAKTGDYYLIEGEDAKWVKAAYTVPLLHRVVWRARIREVTKQRGLESDAMRDYDIRLRHPFNSLTNFKPSFQLRVRESEQKIFAGLFDRHLRKFIHPSSVLAKEWLNHEKSLPFRSFREFWRSFGMPREGSMEVPGIYIDMDDKISPLFDPSLDISVLRTELLSVQSEEAGQNP